MRSQQCLHQEGERQWRSRPPRSVSAWYPSVSGFQRQVRRDLTAAKAPAGACVPMRVATDRMVVGMRRAFDSVQSHAARASVRVAQAFAAQMPRASAAVAQFAAGFQRVESTAKRCRGAHAPVRCDDAPGTRQHVGAATELPRGFRSADGAASALTGRMGSLGGLSRRAFEAAAQPLRNFHAGFTQLGAASSAFSGRMGTLGGCQSSPRDWRTRLHVRPRGNLYPCNGPVDWCIDPERHRHSTARCRTEGRWARSRRGTRKPRLQRTTGRTGHLEHAADVTGLYGSAQDAGDMMER